MADLASSITVARNAGYSDADITAYLAKDPTLGPQVDQARKSGYNDGEIVGFLASQKPKNPSFGDQVRGAVSGAVDKLKADVGSDYQRAQARAGRSAPSLADAAVEAGGDISRTARMVGDAAGVVASPVAGAIHALVVKPGADVLDRIPLNAYSTQDVTKPSTWGQTPRVLNAAEKHAANERIVSTALAGARAPEAPVAGATVPNAYASTVRRFDQAGVDPMLAASGGKGASTMTNVVAENPFAGVAVRGRLRNAVQQTDASAQGLAARYGETRGPQITGENVQAGVQRFARDRRDPTSFAAKAGANYDDVFNKLDTVLAGKTDVGSSQISTPATTRALQDITNSTQSASIGQLVADPTLSRVAQTLGDASAAKDMSFGDLRRLRTWVRDAQKDPELRQKIGPANLSKLEGSLTQDIYKNAGDLGSPQLAQQLRRSDQYYAAGQSRITNALQSFADAQSGESAYNRVVQAAGSTARGDAQKLLSLKRSLAPDEWGDVASNIVSEMGKQGAGAAPAGESGFSVSQFVTKYNQLSLRGRDILFGTVGGGGAKAAELRAALDNLASVADDLKGIEKGANTSKTFVNAQAGGTLLGLTNHVTAVPTAVGLGGMALTGEVLTNPAAVRWLARLGRASKANPAAVRVVQKQLLNAANSNVALMPVYRESMKLLTSPHSLLATAGAETQTQQPTR